MSPIVAPRPTLFIASPRLNRHVGLDVTLASETLQHTGSFKFRAALNNAAQRKAAHLIAVSSGNFGQALAYACELHGKRCTVVMPHDASAAKVRAVRTYGADVDLVDTRTKTRLDRLRELLATFPDAEAAYPSDGEPTLAGAETLADEILTHEPMFDTVVAPAGGGGIIVGLVRATRRLHSRATILACEPVVANDLAQSFRAGERVTLPAEPTSLADGVRGLGVSPANWQVIREGCAGVIEVEEAQIAEATRLLFRLAGLLAEPTAALALAAVLTEPQRFAGQRVCCLVTGANVDPATYARILHEQKPDGDGDW
jgi:threo-3-hydroxy-L-aspartate ammonia-lyase